MALLLAVAFAISCAETLIADVHDGDANAQELAASTLRTALGGAVGAVAATAAGSSAAEASPPVRTAVVATQADDGQPPPAAPGGDPDGSTHAHVCHCTHAHGGMLCCSEAIVSSILLVDQSLHPRSDRLPPSPALERRLRPPAFSLVA